MLAAFSARADGVGGKQERWLDHLESEAIERGRFPARKRHHIRRLTDERLHELVVGQLEDKHQKPITGNSAGASGTDADDGDRRKTEELTKAGRDIDPDEGSE